MVFSCTGWRSDETVVRRLTSWLDGIQQFPKVIIVSHGLTGRILQGVYAGLNKEEALKLEVSQDVLFKLTNKEISRICSNIEDD